MNYSANINGIEYSVSYSDVLVDGTLIPLLRHLSQLHIEKGSRVIVMLAAPPGTGKSTLVREDKTMLEILKNRFTENRDRHPNLEWEYVESRLKDNAVALKALRNMEESGGEPDTIGFDEAGEKLIFCDCSKESPAARRSLCYDDEALQKRKKNPPTGSAVKQAREMGIQLLTEELYYRLQQLGEFDLKTSSWIHAPETIRKKGGALFCERRYGRVFTFHNGADSYYSSRGFRGYICV